jgi:hypothetical protein
MKYAGILPLAMVFATTSALGQYTLPTRVDPAKCPVGMQVTHSGRFVERNAKSGPSDDVVPSIPEQRINLKMTNLLPHDIVNAEITARGFSHNWRVIFVSDTPGVQETRDLAKTVAVALDVKGNSSASRELSFAHFSVIRTVEVNSVTYADGSTWHASSPAACSVAPSLIMPISVQ